jgi:hypothetical protein
LRRKAHGGFGERPGKTDRQQCQHRAPGRLSLAAWCINTRECLAMLLRSGNAGSNTFADYKEVLSAALRQVPASHDLIGHLLGMSSPQWKVMFTCGWAITEADEASITALPADAGGALPAPQEEPHRP